MKLTVACGAWVRATTHGTDHLRQEALVRGIPAGPSDVVEPEAQEERLQPELRILQRDPRGVAGAAQIADRFILHGGHVHGGEVAGAQEPRELDSVPPGRSSPCRRAAAGSRTA